MTQPDGEAGSVLQEGGGMRGVMVLRKDFYCLRILALGKEETNLGKWEGEKPFSQGTSVSKDPEASMQRKE